MDPAIELIYIKDHVPARVRELVDGLSTMEQCWELLDQEYERRAS